MPELPEVETVVRELREEICGDIISSVEIFPVIQLCRETWIRSRNNCAEENLWMLGVGPNI